MKWFGYISGWIVASVVLAYVLGVIAYTGLLMFGGWGFFGALDMALSWPMILVVMWMMAKGK